MLGVLLLGYAFLTQMATITLEEIWDFKKFFVDTERQRIISSYVGISKKERRQGVDRISPMQRIGSALS